jgi:hypothetical protein
VNETVGSHSPRPLSLSSLTSIYLFGWLVSPSAPPYQPQPLHYLCIWLRLYIFSKPSTLNY